MEYRVRGSNLSPGRAPLDPLVNKYAMHMRACLYGVVARSDVVTPCDRFVALTCKNCRGEKRASEAGGRPPSMITWGPVPPTLGGPRVLCVTSAS